MPVTLDTMCYLLKDANSHSQQKNRVVLFVKHTGVWRTLKLICGICAFPTEEMNSYPSPELQEECENLDRGDTQQQVSMTERFGIAY